MASLKSLQIELFCNLVCGGLNRSIEDVWISEIRMSLRDCILDEEGGLEVVPDIINNLGFHTAQYPTTICFAKKRDGYEMGHQVLASWGIEHDDDIFEPLWFYR